MRRADHTVIASYSFTLDDAGNITSETRTEPYSDMILPAGEANYAYNSANRIQTAGDVSFGFDANGNTTSRGSSNYAYDLSDKLTAGDGFNFVYDGLGNILSDGSKHYLIDVVNGNVIAEIDNSGMIAWYFYGQGLEARISGSGG